MSIPLNFLTFPEKTALTTSRIVENSCGCKYVFTFPDNDFYKSLADRQLFLAEVNAKKYITQTGVIKCRKHS